MVKTASKVEKETAATSTYLVMMLDMSWRLAAAVLVPIIGSIQLDKQFNTAPILTIMGFLLAAAGFGLVLWRTVKAASNTTSMEDK